MDVKPPVWSRRQSLSLLATWLLACGLSLFALMSFANTAGAVGHVPDMWPSESTLIPEPDCFNLILTLHPRCACSKATLAALEELLCNFQNNVAVQVLFIRPPDFTDSWTTTTDLWKQAGRLPNTQVHIDRDGKESQRFGGMTSGQLMVFDRQGHRQYHGGITVARGHAGANPGLQAVTDLLCTGESQTPAACVFGCPLFASDDRETGER